VTHWGGGARRPVPASRPRDVADKLLELRD